MAKIQKKNMRLHNLLEEFERRMFLLKLNYEKYFSGIERIEPLKEREDTKRFLRDLMQEPMTNTMQKHKFTSLRARFNSLDLYITRNMVMIERGTHPKMKFRANLRDQQRKDAEIKRAQLQERRRAFSERQKQDLAYKTAYDKFMEARGKCGQSTDMSFDALKNSLNKQVRMIKSKYKCERVNFRVSIEGGKAKMKAIPVKNKD